MSDAVRAYGTLLQMEIAMVMTTIAELTDISGPTLEADELDVTSHSSVDGYREFIQGLKDAGEVSIEGNFLPANNTHDASTGLLSIYDSGEVTGFQIVFPDTDSTTWEFDAIVTGFEPTAPVEEVLTFTASLKVTGKPTLNS
jgi:predicted secreted protein